MTPTLNLTIPATRVLDDHAEYGISCDVSYQPISNTNSVLVWRRYKDFEHLKNSLQRVAPAFLLPNLPPKHSWWTSRSAPIVNERQRQFEIFLHEVEAGLEKPSSAWNIFCQFVGAPASALSGVLPLARRESDDPTTVLQDEVIRLQNHISMMEDEEAKLRQELTTRDGELANLRAKRTDVKQVKEQTTALEREKNHLVVEVARLEALLSSASEAQHELNAIKEENTKVRSEFSLLEGERNELRATLARHDELVDSLRREIARLEGELERMQKEITTLQNTLESNPNEQILQEEISNLKREKGQMELEIARLETAQQSAAAYGANVLAKLEKVEKEKSQQLNELKSTLEAEVKLSSFQRERIKELEEELRVAREALSKMNMELDKASNQTQEVIAANDLLKTSIEGEESELVTLRKEVKSLHDQLAILTADNEILRARTNINMEEIEAKLAKLSKENSDLKTESESNANIKRKLAARVETLVSENLLLKEKYMSVERRIKLLQGD